jgi:hypothetical protein
MADIRSAATSRRAMLGGAVSAVVAGATIATAGHGATLATGADAELLDLCAAFHRQDTVAAALHEDALEAALEQRWGISDRIQRIPALTEVGRRGKASVAVVLMRENNGGDDFASADDAFAYAALRDIAGEATKGDALPNPDADLIALCDRLVVIEAQRCQVLHTIKEDDAQDVALAPIDEESRQIEARVYELGDPVTPAGVAAVARAAVAEAVKNLDGTLQIRDLSDWLALTVVEHMAGRASA